MTSEQVRQRGQAASPRATSARSRFAVAAALLLAALLASLFLAASVGAVPIPWQTLASALSTDPTSWSTQEVILTQVRLPRVLTAACVGAGLAVSGVALQTALRNPLAEPYLLGVSSGASLGAVSVILLGLSLALPFAAFVGGTLALAVTLFLSGGQRQSSSERVILAGVATTALFSACTSFIIFQSPDSDSYRQVLHWLLGSLGGSNWSTVLIATVTLAVFGSALATSSRLLAVFKLSDNDIESLGINVRVSRAWVLSLAALVAAGMVAVSGAIGFVGLIVPHLARPLASGSVTKHLVASALVGALLLTWADTLSRIAAQPQELPVGITTSVLGAIAFGVIMFRQQKGHS